MLKLLQKKKTFRLTMIPGCKLLLDSSFQHNGVKSGNAAQFTAANLEYLSITDNAALSMGDIDFTIAGWFRFDSVASNQALMGKDAIAGVRGYGMYFNQATPALRFTVSPDGTAVTGVNTLSPS